MTGVFRGISLSVVLLLTAVGPVIASDTVIATGEGLVIYRNDIEILKEVFVSTGFETTPGEYMDAMLKVRLFAKEAMALKLGGPLAASGDESLGEAAEMTSDRLRKLLEFYDLYVGYIYDSFPVSDAAIESYYLAFPEKTTRSDDPPSGDGFFRPNTLDDEMKRMVRGRLIQNRKPGLLENEYKRLSEKYKVRVVSGY